MHFFLSTVGDQNATTQLWTAGLLRTSAVQWRFDLEYSCGSLEKEQT